MTPETAGILALLSAAAVWAWFRAPGRLFGYAGIAHGKDEDYLKRLRKRGLLVPIPEDMPAHYGLATNAACEIRRLAWSPHGNLTAMRAILGAGLPVIAVSGRTFSDLNLQVREDPSLIDYFHAQGLDYAEAARAAEEILTGEPSFYFKEISMALVDFKYQPVPLRAPPLGLPSEAALLLPPAGKRLSWLRRIAAVRALRAGLGAGS